MGWASRAAATAAIACFVGGAVVVTVAVVAGPAPGWTGYVSEAGIGPGGYAVVYRVGILVFAAGLLPLSASVAATSRVAAVLFAAAAVGGVLSGAATCSQGCPLPPFEAATASDLVHGGASVAAVGACVLAMPVVAARADARLRRICLAAAAVAFPLSAAVGAGMLAIGRGAVVGIVERALLIAVALWLITLAARLTCAGRSG